MKRRSLEEYQRDRREREREARSASTSQSDDDRRELLKAHGLESLRRLRGDQTWEDWMIVGAALMVITEEAMETIGVTVWDPNNKRLVREFMSRWDQYEYQVGGNQKPLSKQERWALREVMTNPEIGAWRSTLDGYNRRKLNHPNKVIESWRRNTQTSDKEPKKPSPSLSQALKEKNKVIEQLEARNKELSEEAEGERAPLTVAEAVAALVSALEGASPEKRREVLTDLSVQLGFTVQQKKVKRRSAKKDPLQEIEDNNLWLRRLNQHAGH